MLECKKKRNSFLAKIVTNSWENTWEIITELTRVRSPVPKGIMGMVAKIQSASTL